MSCNANKNGCNGGWANVAHNAFSQHGILKERDQPYQCPHAVTHEIWCPSWPWGGHCDGGRNANWHYGGGFKVSGENDMLAVLSQGYSLYVGMNIDFAFQWHTGDFFVRGVSDVGSGGHAMTAIGYGVMPPYNERYWLIQNSWGTGWAAGGFIKVKRGINVGGIEENAFYYRGWVEGSSIPPMPECVDSTKVDGFVGDISCTHLSSWYCQQYTFVKEQCPIMCNSCPTDPPTPHPTPPPATPQPTKPPYSCYCTGDKNRYLCANHREVYSAHCAWWQDCNPKYNLDTGRKFDYGDWAEGCIDKR